MMSLGVVVMQNCLARKCADAYLTAVPDDGSSAPGARAHRNADAVRLQGASSCSSSREVVVVVLAVVVVIVVVFAVIEIV
jgi:hypothetical protein